MAIQQSFMWPIQLYIYCWVDKFVTHNRIVCGDILVFSKLTANMSKFQVYVFDYKGLPVTRRLRSDLMHVLRIEVKVEGE